jgi:hypothetical protein
VTAISHYGSQGVGSTGVSAAIGGTAVAGDLLFVVANLIDGAAYLSTPRVYDNGPDPDAGWTKVADVVGQASDTPGDTYHATWWTKIALGGETGVGVQPASGTATICFNGYFLNSFSTANIYPYVIDQGYEVFTLGVGNYFTTTVAPLTDGEVYVGATANGRYNLTGTTMTDATDGASELIADTLHTVILANNTVGTTTADRPIVGDNRNDIDVHCYVVLFGQSDTPVTPGVDLASTGGLMGGTSDLTVENPGAPLESTGGLMGGTSELTVVPPSHLASAGGLMGGDSTLVSTGGTVLLFSSGGLIGGRALITSPPPFPPVPPTPAMTGQLDCGIYDVFIFTRGLGEIVGRIPFNTLNWTRVLDDTSSAEVTVDGVSNVGTMQDCCALLGSILPWEHEIGLYRNGLREWSGPVSRVTFPSEQVIIEALDLSGWLQARNLHYNHNDVQQDLANIWVEYVQDAMSVENTAGLYATVHALTGVLADRLYTEDMHTLASDAISELARTGLDWYCVDRNMIGGPVPQQPPAYPDAPPVPTLIDQSFRDAPTVVRDGDLMGNCIYSNASGSGPGGNAIFGEYGPEFPDTPDHVAQPAAPDYAAIEEQFGRIERVFQETKILDQPSADQSAATRYDLLKLPVDVISEGTLLPTAGIDMRQLIPGSVQNVHLTRACVQIGAPYRLKQLTVTANGDGSEDVVGTWEPLGSLAAHEDLD